MVADAARFLASIADEQEQLRAIHHKARKPDPDPFTATPTIHFGAHLWPVANYWQWHVELWNKMPDLINGKLIVFVATNKNGSMFREVRSALHPAFECIDIPNTPEGENPSFRRLQSMIPADQNDVLIYCHGKGAQHRTYKSAAVRAWSEAMYESVIFNPGEIIRRMGEGYKNFHSFRMFSSILGTKHRWHPSGTFFAVRAKHLPNKPVRQGYGGVEAWCGEHFASCESWCELGDGVMFTDLYDHDRFTLVVQPLLESWRAQRQAVHVSFHHKASENHKNSRHSESTAITPVAVVFTHNDL